VDQRHRADECSQQPHAVDLDRDTELEQGELQIDRVPAEAIRARADDHGGGGIPAFCKRQDCHLQPFSFSCKTESRFQIATLRTRQQGSAFNPGPDEITESNRHESRYVKSMHQKVLLMKKYLLLFLLAFGLVVFVPQKSKADDYLGISVGPAYCDPYPVYYGRYYPRYYRHYYYYDNPYEYGYWHRHRHWHHHDDDDD